MTKQRELILSILKQSDRHLTADEIFFLAKLKMPSIAMATIYNNLNAMNELGLIAINEGLYDFEIEMRRVDKKVDLNASVIITKLREVSR